jgi:hypothetical protein
MLRVQLPLLLQKLLLLQLLGAAASSYCPAAVTIKQANPSSCS